MSDHLLSSHTFNPWRSSQNTEFAITIFLSTFLFFVSITIIIIITVSIYRERSTVILPYPWGICMFQDPQRMLEAWIIPSPRSTKFFPISTFLWQSLICKLGIVGAWPLLITWNIITIYFYISYVNVVSLSLSQNSLLPCTQPSSWDAARW